MRFDELYDEDNGGTGGLGGGAFGGIEDAELRRKPMRLFIDFFTSGERAVVVGEVTGIGSWLKIGDILNLC